MNYQNYHIHRFHGTHGAVAKMISDYCEKANVRVHTFQFLGYEKDGSRNWGGSYLVLFEKVM